MCMNLCLYVSMYAMKSQSSLEHDTEQNLEHDMVKARALIPSQRSMSIHRKSSRYDQERTLQCLYGAKARCPVNRKVPMSHRGQAPKCNISQPLNVSYRANALPSTGLRFSFDCRLRTSTEMEIRMVRNQYERLNAKASTRSLNLISHPSSPESAPEQAI